MFLFRIFCLSLALSFCFLVSCGDSTIQNPNENLSSASQNSSSSKNNSSSQNILEAIQESGKYTTKDSVSAYIHKFHKLPQNYIDKASGQTLYESKTGNAFSKWNFNPLSVLGVMIGGDTFSNREGLLPSGNYKECDVDYHDSSRGTKRLVYTTSGIVYYTANHYETFSLVYSE